MELAVFIWLTSFIPAIKAGFLWICLAILVYIVCVVCHAAFNSDTDYTKAYKPENYRRAMEVWKFKWLKWPAISLTLLYVIAATLPTQKTMYMMAAGYAGQKTVQSEAADKIVKILNTKLDEYLKETEDKLKK